MVAAELTIAGAVTSIVTTASSVMTIIEGNELLFTLFCSSIIYVACSVVRKLKKTAKA